VECNAERNRGLYVLKSLGMAHSNQIRKYLLTERGLEILDMTLAGQGKWLVSEPLGGAAGAQGGPPPLPKADTTEGNP
jgi:hypothetical protein